MSSLYRKGRRFCHDRVSQAGANEKRTFFTSFTKLLTFMILLRFHLGVSRMYQLPLVDIDPLYPLGEVERILQQIFPAGGPSRPTLISMCETGEFEGTQLGRGRTWYVYKSSLDQYIIHCQAPRNHKLAA